MFNTRQYSWPLFIFLGALCQYVSAESTSGLIGKVLKGDHRAEVHKSRDIYRNPASTLAFFGLREDMTVVEIWPGGSGWYTEVLAPVLRRKGKLYAVHFDPDSDIAYFKKSHKKFIEKISLRPDIYDKMVITALHPPKMVEIAPAGSADMVLTFRNVHNWMRNGQLSNVFKAMYQALKPGGILGVVEHRAGTDQAQDPKAESGYVREDYVIDIARRTGFKLVEKSNINANPKDSTDHPKGVWTLPPTLRLKDQNRDQYLAIGESDRMTLKFIKP